MKGDINFRQHIPDFVSGFEPQVATFANRAELDAIPCVAANIAAPGFYRLSVSHNPRGHDLLMAEFDDGRRWYVVGYVDAAIGWLSAWEPKPGKGEKE